MVAESRWPPVYDFDDLTSTIRSIVDSQSLEKRLYEPRRPFSSFFQGDIIRLRSELPFVGADGQPQVEEPPPYWTIIGNTCDLDKGIESISFTQLIPLLNVGRTIDLQRKIPELRRYRYYTQFYTPPWNESEQEHVFVADFLRPVAVHKEALTKAEVVARLTREGWILFHSCLVRFLARDDGRYDEG
jgi:hypothetical protein